MDTNKTRCRKVETNKVTRFHSFPAYDAQDRQLGVMVVVSEVDYIAAPDAEFAYIVEPGHYFTAEIQSARDTKPFGASQRTHLFATNQERNAWIVERMNAARAKAVASR